MLKITISPEKLTFKWLKVGDSELNRFDVGGGKEIAKKLENSKSKKLCKSQKLAKSEKKLSKSGNSPNFNAIKAGLKFLILDARTSFNCLWLAFIKASIL